MEVSFVLPKNRSNAIKVVGVGGGGGNAVEYMYSQQIEGVDFVVCNTDAQALKESPVPVKIQLGVELTQGMGAGSNPDVGYQAALESEEQIRNILSVNTKMVFITAGMGGGTGTGAAPVIARISRELDLLTVAIVTTPFDFEGDKRMKEARKGIKKLREYVDAIIVINNNKLVDVYGDLGYKAGFAKADEVLAAAARGMAGVITQHYKRNIDLNDAKTVLANSGNAIMGSAQAEGEDRAKRVIADALSSPLLNDNKIKGATQVLLLIISGKKEVTLKEISEINKFIQKQAATNVNIILGIGDEPKLGEGIAVTVIATGFPGGYQNKINATPPKKVVHALNEEQAVQVDLFSVVEEDDPDEFEDDTPEDKIVYALDDEDVQPEMPDAGLDELHTPIEALEIEVDFEEQFPEPGKPDMLADNNDPETLDLFEINGENEQLSGEPDTPDVEGMPEADAPVLDFSGMKDESGIMESGAVFPEEKEEQREMEGPVLDFSEMKEEDGLSVTANLPEVKDENEENIPLLNEDAGQKRFDQMSLTFPEDTGNVSEEESAVSNDEKIVHRLEDISEEESAVSNDEKIVHQLEDTPEEIQVHKPIPVQEEEVEEEMKITLKTVENNDQETGEDAEISPVSRTIQEVRKSKLKRKESWKEKFNHSFDSFSGNIKEMEKEPAYKRRNVEIQNGTKDDEVSDTSLETDENGEIHLNSENSFLHGNVD